MIYKKIAEIKNKLLTDKSFNNFELYLAEENLLLLQPIMQGMNGDNVIKTMFVDLDETDEDEDKKESFVVSTKYDPEKDLKTQQRETLHLIFAIHG